MNVSKLPGVKRCVGDGLSICKRCRELAGYGVFWTSFLFEIEGYEGRYCSDCVREILKEKESE